MSSFPSVQEPLGEKFNAVLRRVERFMSGLGGGNRLKNAEYPATLKGERKAVAQVVGLDRVIGRLIKPFNGVSRVPDTVVTKIEKHINDVSPALRKVVALEEVTPDAGDIMSYALSGRAPETVVEKTSIDYMNNFTSAHGSAIEQRVVRLDLAQRGF